MTIELRNTTINPFPGLFSDVEVDLETAKKLIAHGFVSRIGHESSAKLLSTLLGVDVKVDRSPSSANVVALCIKMNGRLPDNRELSVEDIEAIGYTWRVLSPVMRIPKAGDRVFIQLDHRTGKVSSKGVQILTDKCDNPWKTPGEAFVEVELDDTLDGSKKTVRCWLNEIQLL